MPIITIGQTYEFTKTAGSLSSDAVRDGCIDSFGNYYFVGGYQASIDFKKDFGGGDVRTAVGSSNIFITKLNADKSYAWTKTIFEDELECCITSDLQGNVYVVFTFQAYLTLGTDFVQSSPLYTNGYTDICILKINADGSSGGITRIGGEDFEYIHDAYTDKYGNLYLGGYYISDSIDFGIDFGTSDVKTSTNHKYNAFVTKINADYTYGWTKVFDMQSSYGAINEISVDIEANVFVTGLFQNQVDFKLDFGGSDMKSSMGKQDAFVTKINTDGSYGWTRTYGGKYNDVGSAIASDADGNLYISGYFMDSVNFRKDFGGNDIKYSGSSDPYLFQNMYILKLNKEGDYLYSRILQSSDSYSGSVAIVVDTCGNPIVYGYSGGYRGRYYDETGYLLGDLDFAIDYDTTDFRTDLSGAFYTRLYADGSYNYTKVIKGNTSPFACFLDKKDNIILTGGFFRTANFGFDFGVTDLKKQAPNSDPGQNLYDLFYTFIRLDAKYTSSTLLPNDITHCGSIDTLIQSKRNWSTYLWSDGSINSSLEVTQPGDYWLQVNTGTCTFRDSIKVTTLAVPSFLLSSESNYFPTGEISLNDRDTITLQPNSNDPITLNFKATVTSFEPTATNWYINNKLLYEDLNFSRNFFLEGATTIVSKVLAQDGCFSEKRTVVVVKPLLFIPNLITSNNDSKNDVFEIFYNGNTDYELSIYNRWGDQVFMSLDRFDYWTGIDDSDAIYFYHLRLGNKEYKGWVQLVK